MDPATTSDAQAFNRRFSVLDHAVQMWGTGLHKAVWHVMTEGGTERAGSSSLAEGLKSWMGDLAHGGCASGFVTSLVYYSDTGEWYAQHQRDIQNLVRGAMAISETSFNPETGEGHPAISPAQILRDWDLADYWADGVHNQNLLAWFSFEATAHELWESLCAGAWFPCGAMTLDSYPDTGEWEPIKHRATGEFLGGKIKRATAPDGSRLGIVRVGQVVAVDLDGDAPAYWMPAALQRVFRGVPSYVVFDDTKVP